jgi:hypothetical protein
VVPTGRQEADNIFPTCRGKNVGDPSAVPPKLKRGCPSLRAGLVTFPEQVARFHRRNEPNGGHVRDPLGDVEKVRWSWTDEAFDPQRADISSRSKGNNCCAKCNREEMVSVGRPAHNCRIQHALCVLASTKERTMPKYLLEVNYTLDGIRGVKANGGSARVAAATELIESLGGKLESFNFCLRRNRRLCHRRFPRQRVRRRGRVHGVRRRWGHRSNSAPIDRRRSRLGCGKELDVPAADELSAPGSSVSPRVGRTAAQVVETSAS